MDTARAYEIAANWHDKHARGCREISDDYRVGEEIQAKARAAGLHHAASAAGLRLAATNLKRAELSRISSAR